MKFYLPSLLLFLALTIHAGRIKRKHSTDKENSNLSVNSPVKRPCSSFESCSNAVNLNRISNDMIYEMFDRMDIDDLSIIARTDRKMRDLVYQYLPAFKSHRRVLEFCGHYHANALILALLTGRLNNYNINLGAYSVNCMKSISDMCGAYEVNQVPGTTRRTLHPLNFNVYNTGEAHKISHLKNCRVNLHISGLPDTASLIAVFSNIRVIELKITDALSENENSGIITLHALASTENFVESLTLISLIPCREDCGQSLGSVLASSNSNIKHLYIYPKINTAAAIALLNQIEYTRIESLKISLDGHEDNILVMHKLKSLVSDEMLSNLMYLDLSASPFTDDMTRILSDVIRMPTNQIIRLDLNSCSISKQGVKDLAAGIRNTECKLKELHLDYNNDIGEMEKNLILKVFFGRNMKNLAISIL